MNAPRGRNTKATTSFRMSADILMTRDAPRKYRVSRFDYSLASCGVITERGWRHSAEETAVTIGRSGGYRMPRPPPLLITANNPAIRHAVITTCSAVPACVPTHSSVKRPRCARRKRGQKRRRLLSDKTSRLIRGDEWLMLDAGNFPTTVSPAPSS